MSDGLSLRTLRKFLPTRRQESHKGDYGHVLLIAGSRGMSGAAVLAARAALRAGAGLVTAAVPESQQPIVAACVPEALTLPLSETSAGTLRTESLGRLLAAHQSRGFAALAIGPGLGTHPDTLKAVIGALGSLKIPAVIDADALNVLALQPRDQIRALLESRGSPSVMTPHPGEAGRLLRLKTREIQDDRRKSADSLAKEYGCVCVLKGWRTVVSDGASCWINPTGNPGLAKGGAGDVLTGIIAGIWAQHLASRSSAGALQAAALGVYLHGLAADIAALAKTTRSLLASDVIEALPDAFQKAGLH
ncbi:MAG: NAD(P)H-hydrate dehydratase [Elusimicrobia bacterium]|nr:NAD(P)H-hydrate dehydratase [Elusimicrobiota bacterium]